MQLILTVPFMNLLYKEHIEQVDNCPPNDYYPPKQQVFRWVFSEIDHESNFVPQGVQKPRRFNSQNDLEKKCSLLALSVFSTISAAETKYSELITTLPNFPKTVGTCMAMANLIESDGLISPPDMEGHHNWHPSSEVNFIHKFEIIGLIIK